MGTSVLVHSPKAADTPSRLAIALGVKPSTVVARINQPGCGSVVLAASWRSLRATIEVPRVATILDVSPAKGRGIAGDLRGGRQGAPRVQLVQYQIAWCAILPVGIN
jgi:hypothetical protein